MFKYLIFIVILVVSSCASEKPSGKTEAEVLYKEAKILMEDERYLLATEKLQSLKNQYPYSYYATPAELMLADILFLQESYSDAAAAYVLFRDFHPKHEKIPYVIFKTAESYYKQIPDTFDRDLDSATEAIRYYSELLSKYPNSVEVKEGKRKIRKAKRMLENKEKYIADFYFKTEVYSAARWRYLDILENFKSKKLRRHSMFRVIESSYFLKEYDKCFTYAKSYKEELKNTHASSVKKYIKDCGKKI